jgi:hypothetical protein
VPAFGAVHIRSAHFLLPAVALQTPASVVPSGQRWGETEIKSGREDERLFTVVKRAERDVDSKAL